MYKYYMSKNLLLTIIILLLLIFFLRIYTKETFSENQLFNDLMDNHY